MAEYFLRPSARIDSIEAAQYIGENNPYAAERFLIAIEKTCIQIADMPELGRNVRAENSKLHQIRMLPMSRPYKDFLIFYQQSTRGIDIIRILHGSRDYPRLFNLKT